MEYLIYVILRRRDVNKQSPDMETKSKSLIMKSHRLTFTKNNKCKQKQQKNNRFHVLHTYIHTYKHTYKHTYDDLPATMIFLSDPRKQMYQYVPRALPWVQTAYDLIGRSRCVVVMISSVVFRRRRKYKNLNLKIWCCQEEKNK